MSNPKESPLLSLKKNICKLQSLLVDHIAFCYLPQDETDYEKFMVGLPSEMVAKVAGRLRGVFESNLGGNVEVRVEDYLVDEAN